MPPMRADRGMATYVLIHGAGDVGWYWHLVERELRTRGHSVVVMDLPVDDDAATLSDYADVVVEAIGDRREDLIVVAQSYGGYVAPIVCDRVPARLMVLVAAMIPAPAESADQMWVNTRFGEAAPPETDDSGDLATWRPSTTTFRARWRKRRCPGVAVSRRRHRPSRSRSQRGPTCRQRSSSVVTTGSSLRPGCVR
jgi:pimeloyl-ACP methyl ester carboxylesterase